MNLDLHTLGVIGIAVGISISLSFTLLGLVLRGLPALRIWAAGFWVLTLGALTQGLDAGGVLRAPLIGDGLIALANALMLKGIAVQVGYPLRWRWPIGLVVGYTMLQAGLALGHASASHEAAVFGVHSVVWDAWMVWLLLWRSPRDLRATAACTAAVFVIDAGFYLARSAVAVLPAAAQSPAFDEFLQSSNYIFGILFTFFLSTGFTLMLAQRLTLDLLRIARTDGLTGLPNRTALMEEGGQLVASCGRQGEHCCVLMFDLDSFKAINDRWGHVAGDAVLRHFVSVVLHVDLPRGALFARHGGEEFVLVLARVDPSRVYALAEQMRARLAQSPASYKGLPIAVTTSVGIAEVTSGRDFETLVMAADAALYRAKSKGRNRVEWDDERHLAMS